MRLLVRLVVCRTKVGWWYIVVDPYGNGTDKVTQMMVILSLGGQLQRQGFLWHIVNILVADAYILVADARSLVDDVTNTVGRYVETLGNYWYMILDAQSNKRKFAASSQFKGPRPSMYTKMSANGGRFSVKTASEVGIFFAFYIDSCVEGWLPS